jgi:hypothetical protein
VTEPTPPTPEELEARKNEAEVVKAEAESQKAAAEAARAQAEAAKAAAEARTAEAKIAADSAAAEANARKIIAEADKDAAAARQAQLSALIPDLGAVKESTLEVKEGPPLYSTVLTFGALRGVASKIADTIGAKLPTDNTPCRVLLTAEPDLASADAVFQDVSTGLGQLKTAAKVLLDQIAGEPRRDMAAFGAGDVVAALAGAVPAVLSMFSSKRTLSSAAVTVGDLAATAAVAGALKQTTGNNVTIVHDDFRLVPGTGVYQSSGELNAERLKLVGVRLTLSDQKRQADTDLVTKKAEEKELESALAKSGNNPPGDLPQKLEAVRGESLS